MLDVTAPAFPEDDARVVVYWAPKVGFSSVVTLVDRIRHLVGDLPRLDKLIEAWGEQAKTSISTAGTDLADCQANLVAYWEGPAFDSFTTYANSVADVIDVTTGVLGDMGELMRECARVVTEGYIAALGFLHDCARTITSYVEGGLGTFGQIGIAAIAANLVRAFNTFVDGVHDLIEKLMGQLGDFHRQAAAIRSTIIDLEVPSPYPAPAALPDNWQVRPRPAIS